MTTPELKAGPDGAIVTVALALIVNVFCKICVTVRSVGVVPSPTTVSPS